MARQLASEITVKGSSLHELLGREVELRVNRFCWGNIKNGFRKILRKAKFPATYPADIYLFKVNNGNTRAIREICLK